MNLKKLELQVLKDKFNTESYHVRKEVANVFVANFSLYPLGEKIKRYNSLSSVKFRQKFIFNEFCYLVKKECFFNICAHAGIDLDKSLTYYFLNKESELFNTILL